MPLRALPAPLIAALVLVLLIPTATVHAATREGSDPVTVTALAVAEDAQGTFVGVHATVTAQVLAGGSGQVFVATKPLAQTDMQGSARLASRVAAHTLGLDWDAYDFLVTFQSNSSVIGGPSAGGVMALALTVALHNLDQPAAAWTLDTQVAATGTINPDGTIGPVGGIPAKAQGARDAGIRTFLYPAGLDIATTQVRGQPVAVDMQQHCKDLGITCRPAATLGDLLAAAAGVDLSLPDQDLPGTTDYADVLRASVAEQVKDLARRIDAAEGNQQGLTPQESQRVERELDAARERLGGAEAALADGRFYLAATRSFQGAIAAGSAEAVAAFLASDQPRRVLDDHVRGCQDAAAEASALADPLRSSGLTSLYAVGAAQQRASLARELAEQAAAQAQTNLEEEALRALGTASFCNERAGTAAWWADLRDAFPDGPDIADLPGLARDTLDEARDMVAYAQAVLGLAEVADAASSLAGAQAQAAAGRYDAAVVGAVEAQTEASVAMQAVGGAGVPAAVLEAAQQSAARAIAAARAAGIEPVLSVSLVELAQDQNDTGAALGHLWTARTLALLDQAQPAVTPRPTATRAATSADSVEGGILAAAVGAIVGGGLLAIIVLAVDSSRRRR